MNESELIVKDISRLNKSKARRFIDKLDRTQILFLTILLVLLALGVTAEFNGKRYIDISLFGAMWIIAAVIFMLWVFAVKKDIDESGIKKLSIPKQVALLYFYIHRFQRTQPSLFPMGQIKITPKINRTKLNGRPWLDVFMVQILRSSGYTIDYIMKLDPYQGTIEFSDETQTGFPDEPTGTFFISMPNHNDSKYERDKKGRIRSSFSSDIGRFARKYPGGGGR